MEIRSRAEKKTLWMSLKTLQIDGLLTLMPGCENETNLNRVPFLKCKTCVHQLDYIREMSIVLFCQPTAL